MNQQTKWLRAKCITKRIAMKKREGLELKEGSFKTILQGDIRG